MTYEKKLLDHGYLKVIEHWGSDERIIEAARMSTAKGFLGWGDLCERCGAPAWKRGQASNDGFVKSDDPNTRWCSSCRDVVSGKPGDEKLLKYLWDNRHSTPFEMAGIVVEIKAPISVFRQWHRHRTWAYNEMSARYTPLPNENYVPTIERLLMNSSANKQAGTIKGADTLTSDKAQRYRKDLIAAYEADEAFYQHALSIGVPKELAREHLPVGRYSVMRGSANLRNLLAFATLRSDAHAQWEIRQYSDSMVEAISQLFPRTHALFIGAV